MSDLKEEVVVGHSTPDHLNQSSSLDSPYVRNPGDPGNSNRDGDAVAEIERNYKDTPYFRTKEFYITILLGQMLAITNTSTSVFTSLLENEGTSMPAFQTFFNYALLNIVFTSYTLYKYGFKGWLQVVYKDGWKYILFAFCDVEGNYFIVKAYQYTTILSAQLISFWAIVVVVIISFIFLRVRYHVSQIVGIFICIGGMGVLMASDHITGSDGGEYSRGSQIEGDLFALLASTFYGLSNTVEEFLVSKRPVYEVLGQLSFYGMIINGVQAAIFDRTSIQTAVWNGQVAGYLVGYTLCLFIFYSFAPLLFRLSSAAFFNISLLTGNFWGVLIGIQALHLHVHWMYPIAFVLIMIGHVVYYLGRKVMAEAIKPWLGRNQEKGVSGLFTAKAKVEANLAAGQTERAAIPV